MKILKRISLFILLILVLVTITGYIYLINTAPQYDGELQVQGLQEETNVFFDDYGVPHIYANNAQDAYFTLGYVHAQDRLFQMEMIRRLASGRMAEILGPELVKTDRFFRTLGLRNIAEESAQSFFSDIKDPFQKQSVAYLKGINAFVKNGTTPIEFKILGIPKTIFNPADMYTTLGYMSLGFTGALKEDPILTTIKEELGEQYIKDWWFYDRLSTDSMNITTQDMSPGISFKCPEEYLNDLDMPLWTGSNGWVIAPKKSKSGKVILANDTHIGFSQPSVWYEAHLEYPDFSFYGNYLAGIPFGVIGHNRNIAWGLTIFPFDNMDLYREKLNPENKNQVWENDHWTDLKLRKEVIKVKDSSDVVFDVKITRHGALMNDVSESISRNVDEPLALWWSFLKMPSRFLESTYNFNHAKGIDDARHAASLIDIIGLNVLYGDHAGNIAWWGSGKIPKRPAHVNPYYILDGASGKDEPIGYYEFSENPHSENPESGFIASANNDPGVFQDKYFPGYYCPENRINRITNYLSGQEKWALEEMKGIHKDVTSDSDLSSIKTIISDIINIESVVSNALQKEALDVLTSWKGNYDLEEAGPVIFTKLMDHIMSDGLSDELGDYNFNSIHNSFGFKFSRPLIIQNETSAWWDNLETKTVIETRSEIFLKAFEKTISELEIQLGDDISQWQWGDVHTLTHVHLIGRQAPFDKIFNVGPFPISGGNGVPNKQDYIVNREGDYKVKGGPALRILIDFDDLENSLNINPTGQSGNVMSQHYDDQTEMYVKGEYRKQMMNNEEIENEGRLLKMRPRE